jgi:hypothetical protein
MKTVMVSSLLLAASTVFAQAVPFEDSVYNYNNSPYNYANSQYNYANSPYNQANSTSNPYAPNAVYDAQGNQNGYKTTTDAGVTNYYNTNGTRKGYSTK